MLKFSSPSNNQLISNAEIMVCRIYTTNQSPLTPRCIYSMWIPILRYLYCGSKIGRVIKTSNAIVCDPSWGPLFGNYDNGSNDLTMNAYGKWTSATNAYPNINIPRKFEVDDYEVYQVVYQVDN
ncbi:uncharacterized protein OCT59_005012 [Rhizophagus irregularis]|uniref:uncharacterized protein n=1 Tax=Rhizophagus irregularis TaxID=588596 RepID=UPI00332EA13A|nr:hypothetical protein OCT59_005012 [Rhizophagus irregularis]